MAPKLFARVAARLALAGTIGLVGCSDDAGDSAPDAGEIDLGPSPEDTGPEPDLGPQTDVGFGRPDAGFNDPSIIGQGKEIIGGPRLFVTVRGTLTSTMPPLVVIPTGPMHGQEYLFEPTEFLLGAGGVDDPDRLMVYLDPRATGRSSDGAIGDAEVTVDNHVKDIQNLFEYIQELVPGTDKIDILGHGYGASIGALFAARFPDRISRLVLSNPHPVDVIDYAIWNEDYRARLTSTESRRLNEVTQFEVCLRNLNECAWQSWSIIGPTWICRENTLILETMDFQYLDFRAFGFFISQDLRNSTYDWSTELGNVPPVPTTVISGPCDPIPTHTPLTYTASISGAVHHVVPGSGHFTMTEQADEFQRIVRRALTY